MRRIKNRLIDDEFYMPTQIDLGTAQKDITKPTETPIPLSKGFDGLPKFNELQEAQKKSMPKAMRSQVAFQQKKLQYSNYQIINFRIKPTDSSTSQAYYSNEYNKATAVGTALTDGVLFGTNTKNSDIAKYYNIIYANARFLTDPPPVVSSTDFIVSPSFVEFYLMQKVPEGVFGGKIPRQIEAVKDETGLSSLTVSGTEYGVQSFGVDVRNENVYYQQTKEISGLRACGIALSTIHLNFGGAITISEIALDLEIGIDLTTEGNNY